MNKVIIGKSRCSKTSRIIESIKKDLKNQEEKIFLIVPDQFTFETERQLIEQTGGVGLFNIEVLSFRNLILRLRDELGTKAYKELNEVSKAIYTNKLLYDYNNELTLYKNKYKNADFSVMLSKVITECKQFNINPSEISTLPLQNDKLKSKLQDISLIFDAYTKFKGDYMDNEDIINTIIKRIPHSNLLKNSIVYIDHFDVFTFQGFNIIKEISKIAKDLTIALCTNKSNESLFDITRNTLEKLEEIISPLEVIEIKRTYENSILKFADNLFASNENRLALDDNSIELFKFTDALFEIDYITSKVIELKNKGYTFREISILTWDEQFKMLEQSFIDNNIPYFLDKKTPLMTNRFAKFIIYALKNCQYVDIQNIIAMLKQYIMPIKQEDVFIFENYLLEFGYKNTFSTSKEPIQSIAKLASINNLKKEISKCTSIDCFCKATLKFLENYEIEFCDELDEKAYTSIIETLSNISEIFSKTESTLKEFIDMLVVGFNSVTISTVPPQKDAVLIGDISRTKLHNSKCLLIMGATEGKIPKVTEKSGIITEYDTAILNNHGIKLGRDTKDLNSLEKLLTYKAISNPSDYLLISYSVRNIFGSENYPSMIFNRAKSLLGDDCIIQSNYPAKKSIDLMLLNSKPIAFKNLISCLKKDELSPVFESVYHYFDKENDMTSLLKPKAYDLAITKEDAKRIYSKDSISATKVEQYFECAFKHFITYGLNAKENHLFEISSLDTGKLMHLVIEKFTGLIINNEEISYEKIDATVDTIIKDSIDENSIYLKDNIGKIMIYRVSKIIKSALVNIKNNLDSTGFSIKFAELDLSKIEPFYLENDENKLNLIGKIDRIDINEEKGEIRVVDYKTSQKELDFTKVYNGIKIQLFLYMDALLKSYKKNQMHDPIPYEIAYMRLNKQSDSAKSVEELDKVKLKMDSNTYEYNGLSLNDMQGEDFEAKISEFKKIIEFGNKKACQAVKEIYSGKIDINPYFINPDNNACKYCKYKNICKNENVKRQLETINKEEFILRTK